MVVKIIEDVEKLNTFKTFLRENKLKNDYEKSGKVVNFETYKSMNETKLRNKQYSGEDLEKELLELLKQFYKNKAKETFIFVNYVFGYNEIDLMIVNENYLLVLEIKDWNCEVVNNDKYMELIYENVSYKLIKDNPIIHLNEKCHSIKEFLTISTSNKIKDYPIYRALFIRCKNLIDRNNDYIISDKTKLIEVLQNIENKRTNTYNLNYIIEKINTLNKI